MSNADYTYAGTRANTLKNMLLNETQRELLVTAKGVAEVDKALFDTYLAPHLSRTGDIQVSDAIDESLYEAKKVLVSIAPNPRALDIIWVSFDFHNLKTIHKGRVVGLNDEAILANCFSLGTVEPDVLLKHYDEQKLGIINPHFGVAAEKMKQAKEELEIDLFANSEYFKCRKQIADEVKDEFVSTYVRLHIDLFNLKAALRSFAINGIEVEDVCVSGGSYDCKELESPEHVFSKLARFGGEARWSGAIEHFKKTGYYNQFEKVADEHIAGYVHEESRAIFTPASLFLYFREIENDGQIIRTVLTAKQSGMPEKELRGILREVHT